MTKNKYVDGYRARHRKARLCIYCPSPVAKGNSNYCEHHVEITNKKRRLKYRYNIYKNEAQ